MATTKNMRDTRVSLALALALVITIMGLHVVIEGAVWWVQLSLLSTLLVGAAALVRRRAKRRWVPSIIALAVQLVVLTVFFVPATALIGIIPTPSSFAAFGALYSEALQSINRQSVPATIDNSLSFLLCLGVGLVAIAADSLANAFSVPALAGLPLLVLLAVPSVVSIESTDPAVFVVGALSYLWILRSASARRQTRASFVLAAVVIAGTLIVPLVVPATGVAVVASRGMSTGVNPVLSLGSDLRQDVDHQVLQYTTKSGDATYLRLATVDNFTGSNWSPDIYRIDRTNQPENIAAPPGLSADVARTTDETDISVRDLASPWVPVPYPASAVTGLRGDWYWNADNQSLASPNRTSQNQNYSATHLRVAPTPQQLAAAGATVPAGFTKYLQLPANMPRNIKATAESVAGQASTNYDKALLLQNFFRLSDFSYSETAPVDDGYDGTGVQVISKFLKEKSGYCIHFASAMAVMARSLGIPSRVDIGFLPGTRAGIGDKGRTSYDVSSHDLHAWPELYFEGIGWTRFEPTVSRGDLPSYADPQIADVPVPLNEPDTGQSTTSTPTPSAVPSASASAGVLSPIAIATHPAAAISLIVLPILLVIAVILLAVPALIRYRRRGMRLRAVRSGTAPIGLAWQEIRDTARDLGMPMPEGATPREYANGLGPVAGDAGLRRLRIAVEEESFARGDQRIKDHHGAADDAAGVIAQLKASTTRQHRVRAALAPRTGWTWMTRWLSGRR